MFWCDVVAFFDEFVEEFDSLFFVDEILFECEEEHRCCSEDRHS